MPTVLDPVLGRYLQGFPVLSQGPGDEQNAARAAHDLNEYF